MLIMRQADEKDFEKIVEIMEGSAEKEELEGL